MKIGAAAWITAVSPESIRVSAKPSSQNGSALLRTPSTTSGTQVTPQRRETRPADQQRQQDEHADDEAPQDDDGRLELVHAELDEHERRAPDRGEQQEEGGVAAAHPRV